jgi:hypothetical protein
MFGDNPPESTIIVHYAEKTHYFSAMIGPR